MSRAPQRDFRPAVHDSEGLAIAHASGEHIWRPLGNPTALRTSVYASNNPRGFGLMQRSRSFPHYQDIEAQYEKRPSAWVEPIGAFGNGRVLLFEIPSKQEYNDNIVAFWQPEAWQANANHRLHYRLHWCDDRPTPGIGRVVSSRVGAPGHAGIRDSQRGVKFVVDFAGGELARRGHDSFRTEATLHKGKLLRPVVVNRNPAVDGWRAVMDAEPTSGDPMEVTLRLSDAKPLTETWSYQWKV
jgi:glucans biosynthesis protein